MILLKDPLLEWEEYPTEEVGMVDSLEEEAMVVVETSLGEMEEDLPTYHHATDQADRLAPPGPPGLPGPTGPPGPPAPP